MDWQKLRNDRTLAHVLPLAAFMILMIPYQLTGWPEWKHPDAPWWRHFPTQWLYPLQVIVAGSLLWFFRKNYDLRWSKHIWFGALMGVVGIALWILPTQLHTWMELEGKQEGILKWLGVMPRDDGFNPQDLADKFGGNPAIWWGSFLLRMLRAVVIVALVEELFWRGFLMRFILKPDGNYWKVPFGKPNLRSYLIVTGLFTLAHAPVDYLGCIIFGSLMYWVAVKTKSQLACIVMHAVANLLMGIYAIQFGKYGLW